MTDHEQNIEPQPVGMLQHWQHLRTQAESGALRMDEELGSALQHQAQELIKKLQDMMRPAERLQYVTGFGGLLSAQALAQKFSNKAVADEHSAVKRLMQAIDIAKVMEETYGLAIRRLENADQSTAAALGNAGAQL